MPWTQRPRTTSPLAATALALVPCAVAGLLFALLVRPKIAGGQVIDLQSEGKAVGLPVLEQLQRGKTAALMTAACVMGCYLGGGDEKAVAFARQYGEELGLCFQIVDDILDVTATAEELGKPVGGDQIHEKTTYVSLLGMEEASRLAVERTERAVNALAAFGGEAESLRSLARALLMRQS